MSTIDRTIEKFLRKTVIIRRELQVHDSGKATLLIMCHKILKVEYTLILDHHSLPSCAPQCDPEIEVESSRHVGQPCIRVTWKHLPEKSTLKFEIKCLA